MLVLWVAYTSQAVCRTQEAAEPPLKHGRQSAETDVGCASHSFMFSGCRFVQLQKFSLAKETAAVFSMHSDLPTITSKCGLGVSNNWTGIGIWKGKWNEQLQLTLATGTVQSTIQLHIPVQWLGPTVDRFVALLVQFRSVPQQQQCFVVPPL